MKEKINELIPKAIKAISTTHIADDHGNVQKEYKGYIASIGASIVQAGLLPTLAFYQNDSGKKAHSSNVLQAIRILIAPSQNTNLINLVINSCQEQNANPANITMRELSKIKLLHIEEEILDAIIALKLALRTFKIEGDD